MKNMPNDIFDQLAERDRLAESENVRLAIAEEAAHHALAERIRQLRELEKRGRFLKARGLTLEMLTEALGGEPDA